MQQTESEGFRFFLSSHFFTAIFPSWFTCSFSFVYLTQMQRKLFRCNSNGAFVCREEIKNTLDFSRFKEEGVPRYILGKNVGGQSEELIGPNLK